MVISWLLFIALVLFLIFLTLILFFRWRYLSDFVKLTLLISIALIAFSSGYVTKYAEDEEARKDYYGLMEKSKHEAYLEYDTLTREERDDAKKIFIDADLPIDTRKYIVNQFFDSDIRISKNRQGQ